jgi:hypothetical protein
MLCQNERIEQTKKWSKQAVKVRTSKNNSGIRHLSMQATSTIECQPRIKGYMSPIECLEGEVPDVSNLRVWGCKVWALIPKVDEGKRLWRKRI